MREAPSVEGAARALALDGLVVYPTDTLLGLGARAESARAVDRLLRVKERLGGPPLSFALSSYEEIEPWAELDEDARARIRRSLPGPFTFLVRASRLARRRLAPAMIGPRGTVGIRIPDHAVARDLARLVGPLVATSANRHGQPPARTDAQAPRRFGRSVEVYLPARPPPLGRPSEIVDLTVPSLRVLRRP